MTRTRAAASAAGSRVRSSKAATRTSTASFRNWIPFVAPSSFSRPSRPQRAGALLHAKVALRMNRHARLLWGALLAASLLSACGPSASSPARAKIARLSIATGGTGGVYYVYGGALARVISESVPGVEATAEVTSASIDNLKFLRDGKADIAFTLADTLKDASEGDGAFEGPPIDLRAL